MIRVGVAVIEIYREREKQRKASNAERKQSNSAVSLQGGVWRWYAMIPHRGQ